jgi:hypothetical protein
MSKLSRRTLVTTVAALPVLAMPALASDAIGPNHPEYPSGEGPVHRNVLRSSWPDDLESCK